MKIPQRVSVASRAKLGNTRTHMALEAVPFVRLDMFNLNRKAPCVRSARSVVTKTKLENRPARSARQAITRMRWDARLLVSSAAKDITRTSMLLPDAKSVRWARLWLHKGPCHVQSVNRVVIPTLVDL